MLVRQGDARSTAVDQRLAGTLAAIAGAMNAAAFQALGFFSANMTGNVSSLSIRLSFSDLPDAAFYLSIILTFISGAVASSLLINLGRRKQIPGIYALSILAEAALMALLAVVGPVLPRPAHGSVLVLGLSFLMGLQNAVVTRISGARVRTTHVSGMATDIGIELGVLLDVATGREPPVDGRAARSKLQLHVTTVLSFLIGGVIGVLTYERLGDGLMLICSGVLAIIAVPQAIKAGRARSRQISPD
jgi:uncharacterized membrane protein YoaK (UPF0700 family)